MNFGASPVGFKTSLGIGSVPYYMPSMSAPRWYPSVITLADERALVLGHYGLAGGFAPAPEFRKNFYDSGALTNDLSLNRTRDLAFQGQAAECTTADLGMETYPRSFALRNGMVFVAGPASRGEFLDVEGQYNSFGGYTPCTSPADRFVRGGGAGTFPVTNAEAHRDGGAVHLITPFDPLEEDPLTHGYQETIYAAGGILHYNDDGLVDQCCGCSQNGHHDDGTKLVEKIANPKPAGNVVSGTLTNWIAAPSAGAPPLLNRTRADFTLVVLFDGSLACFAGEQMTPEGCSGGSCSCVAVKVPERYQPPEVFGAAASTSWDDLAPHLHEHRYHSCAAVLPTGKVLLAGGQEFDAAQPSNKTVELYRPPYMFRGPAPIIDEASLHSSGFEKQVGSTFSFDVALGDDDYNIDRIALLRPGSVSHSFDFNQRYVQLQMDTPLPPDPSGVVAITVHLPPHPRYTPPGWYMLTAVDADGRASEAEWIRIVP